MFIQRFEPQGRLFRNVHYCYCPIHGLTGCLQRDHFKSECRLVIHDDGVVCVWFVCVCACMCMCACVCVSVCMCTCTDRCCICLRIHHKGGSGDLRDHSVPLPQILGSSHVGQQHHCTCKTGGAYWNRVWSTNGFGGTLCMWCFTLTGPILHLNQVVSVQTHTLTRHLLNLPIISHGTWLPCVMGRAHVSLYTCVCVLL